MTSTFAVKSTTGTSKLTSVTVFVNKGVLSALGAIGSGGTTPSNLYLYQGSTLVDARSVNGAASSTASSSVTFDLTNYNVTVAADQTQTFTIKADMPSDTTANTVVSTFVQSVTYEKPNGATQTLGALNVPGTAVWHFFAPVVAQFNKVSSTASVVSYGTTVSGLTTTFVVDVTAVGGSLDATAATATVKLLNVGTATSTTLTSSVTFEGGITTIADGATKRGTISVTFPDAQVGSGTFKGQITGMRWKPSSGTAQVQLAGFEALDTNVIAR